MVILERIMSIFAEKSIVADNWPILVTVLLLSAIWLRRNRRNSRNLVIETDKVSLSADDNEEKPVLQPFLEDKPHIPYPGARQTLAGGADQIYRVLNDRRSVRRFSTRAVDFAVIERCIQAAGTSPSGAHTQPWTFCCIHTAAIKRSIRDIIEAEEFLNYTQRMAKQWRVDLQPLRTDHVKEYLTDAPYLILIFKQTYGQREDGQRQQHYYHEISTAIAAGFLLAALQCAGLCSLVTTPLNCGPALRQLLGRPANEKLMMLLPVGYAADDCKVPDLQRKRVEEILVEY